MKLGCSFEENEKSVHTYINLLKVLYVCNNNMYKLRE